MVYLLLSGFYYAVSCGNFAYSEYTQFQNQLKEQQVEQSERERKFRIRSTRTLTGSCLALVCNHDVSMTLDLNVDVTDIKAWRTRSSLWQTIEHYSPFPKV